MTMEALHAFHLPSFRSHTQPNLLRNILHFLLQSELNAFGEGINIQLLR